MPNLVFQYYLPYQGNDKDMGGNQLPGWATAGMKSAARYAEAIGAIHLCSNDIWRPEIDPRLSSLRIFYDPYFEQFDKILSMDLDMLINTRENIFDFDTGDVAMVHELGVHTGSPGGWMRRVMDAPLEQRGTIAYGKLIFGDDWMFPKSSLYPNERFRYLNGGLQVWSKEGRAKAREHFTSIDHYVNTIQRTEQQYINLQLSQSVFNVVELPSIWNRMPYQWLDGRPDGKINHFLNRHKFSMEQASADYSI